MQHIRRSSSSFSVSDPTPVSKALVVARFRSDAVGKPVLGSSRIFGTALVSLARMSRGWFSRLE